MTQKPDHEVVIIGGGIGGIGVGIQLDKAGISDFVILERRGDIGGTWNINHYPDVAVDVPGIAYQFSFELNPDWSRIFPKGEEVKAYIKRLVEKYQLMPHIRLGHEVISRVWDEANHLWRITLKSGDVITARYVVSAIGAFVEPRVPNIEGLDSFQGKVIQTQEWDEDYDFTGKRVGFIGTGATAVQAVPQVAKVAGQLDVYQRRAIWVAPKPDFKIPAAVRWAFRRFPITQRVLRAVGVGVVEVGLVAFVAFGKNLGPVTKLAEWPCRAQLFAQVRDKELRKKLTPDYGYGCKRPSVSNVYYKSFTQPNVDLITTPIKRITPTGIETKDGTLREIDVLVLATGFDMAQDPESYRERPVVGKDGFNLGDYYEHNPAKSYEGVSMPGMPNTFTVFGPFGWTGSSWHVLVENTARHAIRVIQEAYRRGATAVEVTPAALERFDAFIRPRASNSLMHRSSCANSNTYYIDRFGYFSYLRPTTSYQATHASKTFSLDDYHYASLRTS
ncbi:flavin-containing monooxygenase [Segniliparus rugosus]|uniref:Monooxygenase n=1 Tax=Segniliparus rugosus (strain ATCC BAA-974 / DSM 45345 / CCUG 50838 / CIP 108380 / JCM 13579 / CDC 945) TaxID=679197 RepID=E5XS68_SEGRC|nr:NAD(P)/FAD-dependent oxidoreductase [Segniliparus rugosus]EFV12853.1 hypothetical protein HMPREF9336_02340 [Segniliparus rugosus ATCC BAA-974]